MVVLAMAIIGSHDACGGSRRVLPKRQVSTMRTSSLVPVLSLAFIFAGCQSAPPQDGDAPADKKPADAPANAKKDGGAAPKNAPANPAAPGAGAKTPKADSPHAEKTAQKPSDPPPDEAGGGGNQGGAGGALGDFAKEMTLKQQEQKELAKHYVNSGKGLYSELRYREAAANFERAMKLDADNVEARQLYERTAWILGDRSKGELRDTARQLAEERIVRNKEAKVAMERLYQEGRLLMEKQRYDAAIERFERVLETIRWFPYNIDQEGYKAKAEQSVAEAKRLQAEHEARRRQLMQDTAIQESQRQKAEAVKALDSTLKSLARDAREAYAAKKFERCQTICEEILARRPTDSDAQTLREDAIEAAQREHQLRNFRERVEHLRRQRDWVEASSIPYQEIFAFPTREDWAEVSRRDVPLQQKFERNESEGVQEINRRLDAQKITLHFDATPFDEAINFLRDLTGLNYVVSSSAQEKIDNEQLKVSLRLREITLRNALHFILAVNEELVPVIKNDMILITTKGSEKKELFLDFYDVSDIINKTPDFPAPELGLPQKGGAGGKGGLSGGVLSFDSEKKGNVGTGVDADKLVALVENKLGGGSDEGGSVEYSGGVLIVRKSAEAHQKIIQLLEALRRTVGVMVTLEARFVDIQDNFLEEIGVDVLNQPQNPALTTTPNPPDTFGQINRPRSTNGGPTDVQVGYNFVDRSGDYNQRAAIANVLSQPVGNGSSNPFNIVNTGGMALQWNYINDFQLQAIVDAVRKKQKARQINAPRVTVFNGQRSHVMAIRQRAYIQGVEVNQTGVIPVLNPVIGILNTGSILEVQPTVSYDRRYVTLECKPTLAVEGTPRIPAPVTLAQGFTSIPIELPIITIQKIRSTVTIPDGGTVLIGGLKNFEERESETGVPFAMKIPILKNLFRRQGFSQLRRSLIVLIKAQITVIREEEALKFGARPQ